MKYVILKTPIFVWLLIFALIQIFALSSFLPEPFDTRSLLPMGVLTSCSIRVSIEVKDQDGQYAPFKYLWWVILGWTVIGILFSITINAPLELHIALIVHAIAGGIGYRLIERYAVYRYHYL
ncbi:TPA: hypothetical protein U1V73_000269, partial [Streptococcus suis]|nr:hypothetical protein [Streptococcus suis]HEL2070455.1 hypothetical protein [Streptococcus suis]HEL2125200.1 hypothetical protein [Streptococcus suis]HEL2127388.1 hypothetical protein [Streptococcus suis]HEM4021099.1 hypothetical protein [Streptococcus suis]